MLVRAMRWIVFILVILALVAAKLWVIAKVTGSTCGQRSAGEGPNKVYEFYMRIPAATAFLGEVSRWRLGLMGERRRSWGDLRSGG